MATTGGRKLIQEAVADAQSVADLAVEAAKQKLIEKLAPGIRRMVEGRLGEDTDRLRRAKDGYGETEFEEGKKKNSTGDDEMAEKDKDMQMDVQEMLASMFPGITEMEDDMMDAPPAEEAAACPPEMDQDENAIPTLEMSEKGEEEGDMDEHIELSEKELKQAYESLSRAARALDEASVDWSPTVTKGFKDTYPATEWETEDKPPGRKGTVSDEKSGEEAWNDARPTKAQDYTVKEAIERGLAENTELRKYVTYLESQLRKATSMVEGLRKEVHDVNLFNTKMLHVNEILSKYGRSLTREQKKLAIERIDRARDVSTVKEIADTLKETFNLAGKLMEAKRGSKPNAARRTTRGGADPKVIKEHVDRSSGAGGDQFKRMRQLAGLVG